MFTNCIYEAANGIIWVGTREGFYCFNEKEKKIKRYTTANGLPNNVVYGILEDTFGRLWVSTNRGISCFNPETEKFRNFTESEGLSSRSSGRKVVIPLIPPKYICPLEVRQNEEVLN